MNESHALLPARPDVPDGLDSTDEILDCIRKMKDQEATRRKKHKEYLATAQATAQEKAAYKAGHQEVWVRRDNLLEVLMSSLRASSMIYRFATMYEIANKYKSRRASEDAGMVSSIRRWFRNTDTPVIKDTQNLLGRFCPGEMRLKQGEVISGQEVYKFLAENEEEMRKAKVVPKNDPELIPNITDKLPSGDLEYLLSSGAKLVRFDNSMNKGLVYALTVNSDEKRITVTFRGSVTGTDWRKNARWGWKKMPKDKVLVHYGFYDYLHSHGTTGKIGQIVQDIKEVFAEKEEYKTLYRLYIVGHSLGGALAQLLAYEIATTGVMECLVNPNVDSDGNYSEFGVGSPRQVLVVTFGSPYVGNRHFKKSFADNGILHVRVTNHGDIVPTIPPRPMPYREAYAHTGLNIHCQRGAKPIVEDYNDHIANPTRTTNRSVWSQLFNWESPGKAHNLTEYWDHLRDKDLAERDLLHFFTGGGIDMNNPDTCSIL